MDISMIPLRLLLRSMLFFLCCLFSLNAYECAASGSAPVHIYYQADSKNTIYQPRVTSGPEMAGEQLCEKSTMTLWISSGYQGATEVQAYPIPMPCDKNSMISTKDFVQSYLNAAMQASGSGNSITFPEGTFPDNAIMHDLCILSDGFWSFGCSEAINSSNGGELLPSCNVTKNLVFYHEGSRLHGDMVQQTLPVECSDKVSATITVGNSSADQQGYIYVDGANMEAIFSLGSQQISNGRSVTLNKGINNLTLTSLLANKSNEEHKPGFYTAHGILTISID